MPSTRFAHRPALRRPLTSSALLLSCLAGALVACGTSVPAPPALSATRIADLVASPDRSAADRTNDMRRKPADLLAFIAPRPGTTVLDVSTGGGYTTELLARAIGPGGTVYAQYQPRDPAKATPAPAAPEGGEAQRPAPAPSPAAAPARTPATAVAERVQAMRQAGTPSAAIVTVAQRYDNPVPAAVADGGLDLVTLMFNYHDLGFMGVDRVGMDRAIFRALKPGGEFVVADHAGRPGTGISESGTLHRIEEAFLRQEVESVGFKLAAEANFLRNPNDPRDRNTPEPPQPKDDFVLKFVKP